MSTIIASGQDAKRRNAWRCKFFATQHGCNYGQMGKCIRGSAFDAPPLMRSLPTFSREKVRAPQAARSAVSASAEDERKHLQGAKRPVGRTVCLFQKRGRRSTPHGVHKAPHMEGAN